jgi:hypothetical protein
MDHSSGYRKAGDYKWTAEADLMDHSLSRPDVAFLRLRRADSSIANAAFSGPPGTTWVVFGSNGESLIRATGPTQGAALSEAERQARELGMIERMAGRATGRSPMVH